MVLHIEPIANLQTIAIDWQRLACQGIEHHVWDEFLGEMVGAVVVRAVGNQRWETIGSLPSANEVITRGFASRVWRAGRVWCGF